MRRLMTRRVHGRSPIRMTSTRHRVDWRGWITLAWVIFWGGVYCNMARARHRAGGCWNGSALGVSVARMRDSRLSANAVETHRSRPGPDQATRTRVVVAASAIESSSMIVPSSVQAR